MKTYNKICDVKICGRPFSTEYPKTKRCSQCREKTKTHSQSQCIDCEVFFWREKHAHSRRCKKCLTKFESLQKKTRFCQQCNGTLDGLNQKRRRLCTTCRDKKRSRDHYRTCKECCKEFNGTINQYYCDKCKVKINRLQKRREQERRARAEQEKSPTERFRALYRGKEKDESKSIVHRISDEIQKFLDKGGIITRLPTAVARNAFVFNKRMGSLFEGWYEAEEISENGIDHSTYFLKEDEVKEISKFEIENEKKKGEL